MFLLSPQYWLFEGLLLFLLSLFIFWVLSRTRAGRGFLGMVFQWNTPEEVVEEARDIRGRAKRVLPKAAADLERRRGEVDELRQASGQPSDDK